MPKRSDEGDVLTERWADIIEVLQHNLIAFGNEACSAEYKFVSQSKVHNTHSKHGIGNDSKASELMSAVLTNITIQFTPEKITQRFSVFVMLLYNLELNDLAQRLVEELKKKKPSYVSPLPVPQEEISHSEKKKPSYVSPLPVPQEETSHSEKKKPSYLSRLSCSGCNRTIFWAMAFCSAAVLAAYYGLNLDLKKLAGDVAVQTQRMLFSDIQEQPTVTPSSGCLKLKDEDWRSLTEYFSEACKSRTEIETLCDLLMKTQACNDLGRESILNPRNLAKNYLEQNPGACWKDIVRALCEMSKNRIAMKVVEKHNLNIKDCNEIRAS